MCKRVGVEARRYTITEGERSGPTDRCAEHAAAFEEVLETGDRQGAAPVSRTPVAEPAGGPATAGQEPQPKVPVRRRRGAALTSITAIEAKKRTKK
ncbi:hypothetical protein [Streptomyces luteireticuli]|uniref:hypothetical protein n=1 Tax=Streptomyces luteireticuli TaxID=173858 RepID=UPI003558E99E